MNAENDKGDRRRESSEVTLPTSRLFSTLRFRLTVLILVVLLLAVTIMVYTAAETHQRESRRIDTDVHTLVLAIAANHQRFVETTRLLVSVVAQAPNVRDSPAACVNFLTGVLRQSSTYSQFTIVDAGGQTLCAVPALPAANFGAEPWFRQLLTETTLTVSGYVTDSPDSEPVLVLIFPLREPNGKLQTVVSVGVKARKLPELALVGLELPASTEVILVDQQGTVLLHSPRSEQWVGQSIPDSQLIRTVQA